MQGLELLFYDRRMVEGWSRHVSASFKAGCRC